MTVRKYVDKEERIKIENKEISEKTTVLKIAKKKLISHKKYKNDLLEDCVYTLPGIKKDGTCVRKNCPSYDMPYTPSVKSLPCTSFSEATELMNLKNKPVNKFRKRILKQLQNNKNNIEKLLTKDNLSGVVEKNENNKTFVENKKKITDLSNTKFVSEDQTQVRTIQHSYSTKVTDTRKSTPTITESKTTDSVIFASEISYRYLSNEYEMAISTPKVKKNLQKALDGSFNNKTAEKSETIQSLNKSAENIDLFNTKTVANSTEKGNEWKCNQESDEIHKKPSNEYYQVIRHNKKKKTTLVLFDCNKYPLTDSKGKILKTAGGKNLVKYKNGKPYDCFGRDVFDSSGNSSSSSKFKPFSNVCKNNKIISAITLFDFRGYCLLDYDGSSLKNADGKDLVQVDEKGQVLYDINKHPIFDNNGIPITKQMGLWLLPKGVPLRIFDKTKHPLTNKHGEPLHDVKHRELLKCDQHGRPLIDCNDYPVFDTSGVSAAEPRFDPSNVPEKSGLVLIAVLENKPAQLFDKKGWPLTETNGVVMNDSSGQCLLMLKKVYPNEITDFDQLFFRLNDAVPLTEIGHYLPEIKLNSEEDININYRDKTKKRRKIILDFVGHPLCDRFKGKVFDRKGRKIFFNIKSYFIKIGNRPSSSTFCVSDDAFTIQTLNTSQEKILQLTQDKNSAEVVSFQTETDLFGRPLYDSLNRPLFDKYGRPIYDLFGRRLYDSKGRPIASAESKRLDDGLDEPLGINIGFELSCLTSQDPQNLPKCSDLNGGPLFDSLGLPLYNQKGKPLIDAYGRPLYDENGIPQCDKDGRPVSKVVKQINTIISSVEDKIEMLQLSPIETKEPSFNEIEHSPYKRIHEIVKHNNYENLKTSEVMTHFIARMRITTFSDGGKYYEILESVPYPLNTPNENHHTI